MNRAAGSRGTITKDLRRVSLESGRRKHGGEIRAEPLCGSGPQSSWCTERPWKPEGEKLEEIHLVSNLLKTENEEKILKGVREKWQLRKTGVLQEQQKYPEGRVRKDLSARSLSGAKEGADSLTPANGL